MGDWKAIRHKLKGPIELYNLSTDRAEKTNVASEHPDIVEKITKLMASEHTNERNYGAEKGSHTAKDYAR
jgi:spore germination protein GerM